MSCYYAWVFVKSREKRIQDVTTTAAFPEVFTTSDDSTVDSSMIEGEAKRKPSTSDDSETDVHEHIPEPEREGLLSQEYKHDQTRLRHLQMQQPPHYFDVLNDPAMKQKLKERSSRLK